MTEATGRRPPVVVGRTMTGDPGTAVLSPEGKLIVIIGSVMQAASK